MQRYFTFIFDFNLTKNYSMIYFYIYNKIKLSSSSNQIYKDIYFYFTLNLTKDFYIK